MDTAPYVEVRVTQRFGAPAARVFNAWIDPAQAGLWLFATASRPVTRLEIDARASGSFRFVERNGGTDIEHAGEYIEIDQPRRLIFTLRERGLSSGQTRVNVEIVPLKAGCEVTLVHEGVPPDQASRIEGRWAGMLYGLGTLLGR
jgi:uncharacterized protein YndB with AHSA1/START domain